MPSRTNVATAAATLAVAATLALPMLGFTRANSASHAARLSALAVARGIEAMATDTRAYAPAFRTHADGAITHHSAPLLALGYVASEADFTSPLAPGGGAPSAGPHAAQAARTAFTVNAAIMPPEPLTYSGTDRHYRPVPHAGPLPQSGFIPTRQSDAIAPASTLLLTEWLTTDNYAALRQGRTIKSHRPIVPFLGATAGRSPEREAIAGAGPTPFAYPETTDIFADNANFAETLTSAGPTEINAMGRSHPSGNGGGKAALIMLDGSARLATPRQSVTQRLWGATFHSITGGQGVR